MGGSGVLKRKNDVEEGHLVPVVGYEGIKNITRNDKPVQFVPYCQLPRLWYDCDVSLNEVGKP